MKIAVLMGSPRKKDSYRICKILEECFPSSTNAQFEYLFLEKFYIEDCKGCGQCFQKGEKYCPCRDDLALLKERLVHADGIIIASPVYACQITGSLKKVVDRLSYLFHRQELVGKPVVTVVTTEGGGQRPTGKYLKMTACGWGCRLFGEICIISPMFFECNRQEKVGRFHPQYYASSLKHIGNVAEKFEKAISSPLTAAPSFYELYMFQCLRSKTFVSKADFAFWEERGWQNSDYFYKIRLNPIKKLWVKALRLCVNTAVIKMGLAGKHP